MQRQSFNLTVGLAVFFRNASNIYETTGCLTVQTTILRSALFWDITQNSTSRRKPKIKTTILILTTVKAANSIPWGCLKREHWWEYLDVTGKKKQKNKEKYFFPSWNTIGMIKPRRTRWIEHYSERGEDKNFYIMVLWSFEANKSFRRHMHRSKNSVRIQLPQDREYCCRLVNRVMKIRFP